MPRYWTSSLSLGLLIFRTADASIRAAPSSFSVCFDPSITAGLSSSDRQGEGNQPRTAHHRVHIHCRNLANWIRDHCRDGRGEARARRCGRVRKPLPPEALARPLHMPSGLEPARAWSPAHDPAYLKDRPSSATNLACTRPPELHDGGRSSVRG